MTLMRIKNDNFDDKERRKMAKMLLLSKGNDKDKDEDKDKDSHLKNSRNSISLPWEQAFPRIEMNDAPRTLCF